MASIASSGPISFSDIQAVMGGSGPVSIQDYAQSAATRYAKGVPGIGDSNVGIADFQGKSKALLDGLQYRVFRNRYTFSAATSSGTAGTGSYSGGGGAGGVSVNDYTTALGPASSATSAVGSYSGGAGSGFGAGGGGTGTIKARYITFQYGNGNNGNARYLNLGGVRVYSTYGGSNIINSSMATSAYDQHPAFPPTNMVDNDDNTFYHANYTEYPWVKVDMGSEQFIHTIQLANRVDCCRFRIAGVTMQLQDNAGNVIYTSAMCTLPNGTTIYENSGYHMDGYLYYYFYPGTNTNVYGTDSTPSSPFAAGQGASGFAYIQAPTIPNSSITARYLTFEYGNSNGGGGRYIQSSGVRVYGSVGGSNIITSSMTVTASSTFSGSFIPAYLVDNIDTTTYISTDTEYPWVKIDLGSEQPIHRVELMNRYDGAKGRLVGIRLVLSNASNTIVHTSGMVSDKNGAFVYQTNENAFMYYTFWPAISTTPIGSDSIPYPSTEFFTNASTSYTFPSAGTARVLLIGGGGGGGTNAGANSRGGGGGGAGYLQTYFVPVSSGNVATLTVGGSGAQDVSGGTTSAVINGTTYSAAGGGNGNASQTGGSGSTAGGSGGSAAQGSGGGRSFIKARYIQFEYGNGNGGVGRYMHYAGLRVYTTVGGSNIITSSMTVTASDISPGNPPSYLVDGNDSTFYHSTGIEYSWIKVDLGSEQYIHKVELVNRMDCCKGRIAGARMVLSNASDTIIFTSSLMTRSDSVTTYQDYPGNDGFIYYNFWPGVSTAVYGSNSTPYSDPSLNQSGAPSIGHLTSGGGYFADDPTWFDSRTETYTPGLVTNFSSINSATGGIVPNDSSWLGYSVEWFGYFYATVTGTYTFYTSTDDASYVWIGSTALSGFTTANAVVNNAGIHGVQERSGTISLTAGTYYPIRVQFGQNVGGDGYSMSFSAPGISKTSNLAGYVFYGMGTYSSFPINHARLLRATNQATIDRSYYINLAGTATQTYCLMDSKWDGGGWMMLMKATRGTTFQYSSAYWTDNTTTLNTGSTDRTDADAKFAVMNNKPVKDMMALWPDVGATGGSMSQTTAWSWLINNYYYGGQQVTPIFGFSGNYSREATTHFLNTSNPTSFAGYSSSIWSSQPGAYRHVIGGGNYLGANQTVRWGFLWNNEGDFASIDVTGGIGMSHGSYSGGDYYGCCGTQALNRTMRFEMYGR